MKKHGHFEFHIFEQLNLEVFYGDKEECWVAIQKSFVAQEKDVDFGENHENNNGASYYRLGHDPKIWLDKLPNDPKSYGLAAHEADHIVDWLMSTTSIKDREFRGYMVGHIVRMLGIAARKYKTKKY